MSDTCQYLTTYRNHEVGGFFRNVCGDKSDRPAFCGLREREVPMCKAHAQVCEQRIAKLNRAFNVSRGFAE